MINFNPTPLQKFLIIFFILLAISVVFALWWTKEALKKITFSIKKPENIDLGGMIITDVATMLTQSPKITITLNANIENDNGFSIPFSIKKIKLFYQGTFIAETSDALTTQKFEVQPKNSLSIKDDITIIPNDASIKLLKEKVILKQQPVIDYYAKIKIYGIPLTFKKSFVWK